MFRLGRHGTHRDRHRSITEETVNNRTYIDTEKIAGLKNDVF